LVTQLIGCTADTTSPQPGDPDLGDYGFAANVLPLINMACNCHQSSPILMAPFSLKPAEAYANLVNKPAMQLPSMMLVQPGALNESYVWHKINGTQAQVGGQGSIMPSTIPLNAEERRVFERWIAAGATP
jgi:hypothetical protein